MRTWLKNARIEKGMTMKEAGTALGISESYYCSVEAGQRQRHMDITLAAGISVLFGIPIAKIVQLETEMKDNQAKESQAV